MYSNVYSHLEHVSTKEKIVGIVQSGFSKADNPDFDISEGSEHGYHCRNCLPTSKAEAIVIACFPGADS
jgi:hypothetical protein